MTSSIETLKTQLRDSGYEKKAILSDKEMARVLAALNEDKRSRETPDNELRYIEGLFGLPLGYIDSFKFITAKGYERCRCGRTPTALDIVYFALTHHVHSRDLIRDTLLGFQNIFEFSDGGREGECYQCGRKVAFEGYYKKGYAYA
jgi:hypothetical protein